MRYLFWSGQDHCLARPRFMQDYRLLYYHSAICKAHMYAFFQKSGATSRQASKEPSNQNPSDPSSFHDNAPVLPRGSLLDQKLYHVKQIQKLPNLFISPIGASHSKSHRLQHHSPTPPPS
nr:hypothetical protein CFP56_36413 [Quercus suber]